VETLGREVPSLQKQFHRIMSREIVSDHERHGAPRQHACGGAVAALHQPRWMAAGTASLASSLGAANELKIGSFLGVKLETVSRTFSKFQASGLLFVRQRQIRITDPVGLQQLLKDVTV
jgi:CRP/FNR family transcriptional regulator